MGNLERLGVTVATSTKADGNMALRWAEKGREDEVWENRRRFLKTHEAEVHECAVMEVNHGDTVIVVDHASSPETVQAEALITRNPDVVLFLPTADCLPVVFYDPVHGVIALAHLGWKPSALGLATKVLKEMSAHFGTNPADVVVWFGPGIHRESYIVDRISDEQRTDPRWQPFIERTVDDRFRVDLAGFNRARLIEAGIREDMIEVSPVDTAADPAYFSHHRSQKTGEKEGRIATIARLPLVRGVQT